VDIALGFIALGQGGGRYRFRVGRGGQALLHCLCLPNVMKFGV